MNTPNGFKLVPVVPTVHMIAATVADDQGAKGLRAKMAVASYNTMIAAAPTIAQPIYDESSDISELRAELTLAKRYLRQTLAAHNPRSGLSCDIRRLIGMNPIGVKSGEVGHE